ncbi:TIGR00374 family protein [Lentibacillus kapialis]|uniref:Phosphatidylglycerol lysyltransferase n=1 Tax=Lentibacillus kapialis TaxID=340214 RepID=A0A917Q144_9BACI|nr:lysylphosphatidylglycerol synthase transmembrane domain-containing protein [Lentibacillus kapialis]GGK04736.1 TIGR00374 family protein [Lentibacillus kapialis]
MTKGGNLSSNLLIPRLMIGLILGIIVVAVFLLLGDLQKISGVLTEMPISFLGLAFLFTFLSYLMRLWKWHAFSKCAAFPVNLKENAWIFFIGLMMSITPGKAGELVKSYLLQRKAGVPIAQSAPIVVYDRLSDLLAMLALIGVGLLAYPAGIPSVIVVIFGIVVFFLLLGRHRLVAGMIDWVTRARRLRRFRVLLHDFYHQMLFFMQFRILSFSFGISVLAWFLECMSLYVIIQAFGLDVSFVASILTFSLGTFAGALSMIPGGLGVAEGSIAGLLIYFGVASSMAITISLIIRFVTLWFGVILGIIVFILKHKTYFPR